MDLADQQNLNRLPAEALVRAPAGPHVAWVVLLFATTTLALLAIAGIVFREAYVVRYVENNFSEALRLALMGVVPLGLSILVALVGVLEVAARTRRFGPEARPRLDA